MTTQPEALLLADEYDEDGWMVGTKQWCGEAAAELRRLHALNQELLEALTELLTMPEHDGTFSMGKLRKATKDKARAAIAKATGVDHR